MPVLPDPVRSVFCLLCISGRQSPINENDMVCSGECHADAPGPVDADKDAPLSCLEGVDHWLSLLVRGITAHHWYIKVLSDLRCRVLVGTEGDDCRRLVRAFLALCFLLCNTVLFKDFIDCVNGSPCLSPGPCVAKLSKLHQCLP